MSTKQTPTPSQSVLAAGSLDPAFGSGGVLTIPNLDSASNLDIEGIATNLTSKADQRIYVCGWSMPKTYIIRLLEDGEIDVSFGNAGYLQLPSGDPATKDFYHLIYSFIHLDSGKIIGWGEIRTVPFEIFTVPVAVCFTDDGVLDTSFGDQGIAIFKKFIPKPTSENNFNPSRGNSRRARLLNITETEEGRAAGSSRAVKQADGKLLLLGSTNHVSTYYHIASYLIRINLDGSLDTDFGQDGVLLIKDQNHASLPECEHFAIDSKGGIIVMGTHYGTRQPVLIARYDAEGHVDRSFGKNGVVYINNPNGNSCHARGIMALDDGNVILLVSFFVADVINQHAVVIKLLKNGDQDPNFNDGKPVVVDLTPEGYLMARNINVDEDNRIIIGGDRLASPQEACISRLLPGGALDTEFGSNGTAVFERIYHLRNTAIQNRVNILAAAYAYEGDSDNVNLSIIRVSG